MSLVYVHEIDINYVAKQWRNLEIGDRLCIPSRWLPLVNICSEEMEVMVTKLEHFDRYRHKVLVSFDGNSYVICKHLNYWYKVVKMTDNSLKYIQRPLHRIKEGDTIAYFQSELVEADQNPHHREGLYFASVVAKVAYSLRLTSGTLKPSSVYRVVTSQGDLEPSSPAYNLPSREQGKTFKSASGKEVSIE